MLLLTLELPYQLRGAAVRGPGNVTDDANAVGMASPSLSCLAADLCRGPERQQPACASFFPCLLVGPSSFEVSPALDVAREHRRQATHHRTDPSVAVRENSVSVLRIWASFPPSGTATLLCSPCTSRFSYANYITPAIHRTVETRSKMDQSLALMIATPINGITAQRKRAKLEPKYCTVLPETL